MRGLVGGGWPRKARRCTESLNGSIDTQVFRDVQAEGSAYTAKLTLLNYLQSTPGGEGRLHSRKSGTFFYFFLFHDVGKVHRILV